MTKTARRRTRKAKDSKAVPATDRTVTVDDNKRASFLNHRPSWMAAMSKLKAAQAVLNEVVSALKEDGHTKKEMQIADLLAGDRKMELRVITDIATKQRVAQYMGHWLGNQRDLFEQDQAAAPNPYEEGKTACLEGQRASPPKDYVAGSPFHARWLMGYHDAQEVKVRKGIKPLAGDGTLEDKQSAGDDEGDGNPIAEVGERDPARPLADFH